MADATNIAAWNEIFYGDGTSLEYTTNSLGYYAYGQDIVIDITGQGVSDTCQKIIRIPVTPIKRSQWESPEKLYSFWKLRVIGYTAADTNTMEYVISRTKNSITENPKSFTMFYCIIVLSGEFENSTCTVHNEVCSRALQRKQMYDEAFEMDLEFFWSDKAKSLVDELVCSSCSELAGDKMCNAEKVAGAQLLSIIGLFIAATMTA